ncbi:hypothetical protein BDR26DRAFT_1010430 [Obelidium mucronatum]|nr:hypothetical protein BDR26DRAFT_1010430 [Obelidium mucronatum]
MSFRFNFGGNQTEAEDASKQTANDQTTLEARKVDAPTSSQTSLVMGECIRLPSNSFLYRRCLADIKLDAAGLNEDWVDKVMLENTDLLAGVYEGGFKTWECSLDLVNHLSEFQESEFLNKRVLELGCGSALPGLYALSKGSHVDFQDYNELVLKLVTMPNCLINSFSRPEAQEIDGRGLFEVEVDIQAVNNLHCGFYSGDWGSLNSDGGSLYDLILTSETIYHTESHQKLHDVIKRSLKKDGHALIAAKKTYFGCSGDLQQFLELVANNGVFKTELKREFTTGVHRVIYQLSFI